MSCHHITEYREKNKETNKWYEILYCEFVSHSRKGSRHRKAKLCSICQECKNYQRIHACLSCVYFGCFEEHIHVHAGEHDHFIAFDTTFGHIFCFKCNDYIYDEEFEKIALQQMEVTRKTNYLWEQEIKRIVKNKDTSRCLRIYNIDGTHIGLRGIPNTGTSCFINSAIQILIHAPAFRDYLLSKKHRCNKESRLLKTFSTVASEFFSGNKEYFCPESMLAAIYELLPKYADNKHHDSFYFLMDLLEALHCDIGNCTSNCMMSTIFSGFEERETYCPKCRHKSSNSQLLKHVEINLYETSGDENSTLVNFLKKCISCETYTGICEKCNNGKIESKWGFKRLPVVIAVHFLRVFYESKCEKKKCVHIEYPLLLDMREYFLKIPNTFNNSSDFHAKEKYLYYLFGVITHQGLAEAGHYLCYIRQHKNSWFKCNDHRITSVSVEEVCNPKNEDVAAIFYHKKVLEYEEKSHEISV